MVALPIECLVWDGFIGCWSNWDVFYAMILVVVSIYLSKKKKE